MPPKGKPTKERRATTQAKIRLSPFRLHIRPAASGFICEFAGMIEGERIDVELEFPLWWAAELIEKLATIKVKGGT